jgi:hypothetical protein
MDIQEQNGPGLTATKKKAENPLRLFFYRYPYAQTRVGEKWLFVVVRYQPDDAFAVTAYLTDQIKPGDTICPKK